MEFEPKIAFFKTASIYGVSSKKSIYFKPASIYGIQAKKTAKRRKFVAAPEIAKIRYICLALCVFSKNACRFSRTSDATEAG